MLLFQLRDEADLQFHILQLHHVTGSHRPVLVAFYGAPFHQTVQHEDGFGLVLPDHEPEVADRRLQWTLCQDVTATGLLHVHQTGIDVVVAAGQADPAVVICGTAPVRRVSGVTILTGRDVPVPIQVPVLPLSGLPVCVLVVELVRLVPDLLQRLRVDT